MKVLIVDSEDITRKGIITLLKEKNEDLDFKEASSLEEGKNILLVYPIDLVIMDVNINKKNGIHLIKEVQEKGINPKFLILTHSKRKGDFAKAKELGVEGYILKSATITDISYAIDCVKRGKKYYDTQLSEENNSERRKILSILTEREQEVFFQLGKGLTNTQIAEVLFISENTVKKHISSLLSKLGLTHRTEAAVYATKLWRREDDRIESNTSK